MLKSFKEKYLALKKGEQTGQGHNFESDLEKTVQKNENEFKFMLSLALL